MDSKKDSSSGIFGSLFGVSNAPAAPSQPATAGGAGAVKGSDASRPEDIPKEELLHLCMKMNKRMHALETKHTELTKKYKDTVEEKRQLLDIIKTYISASVTITDEETLDVANIREKVMLNNVSHKENIKQLEDRIMQSEREHAKELVNLENKIRRESVAQVNRAALASTSDSSVPGEGVDVRYLTNEIERLTSLNEVK
jgi:hypothetical protein